MELKPHVQTQYRTEVLELVRMRTQARLREFFGEDARVDFVADVLGRAAEDVCRALIMNVTQPVWIQPGENFTVSYPADWWQAFKDRWFPHWLRLRYPVVYTTKGIKVRLLYPEQAFPKQHHQVQVACWDEDYWNWNARRR